MSKYLCEIIAKYLLFVTLLLYKPYLPTDQREKAENEGRGTERNTGRWTRHVYQATGKKYYTELFHCLNLSSLSNKKNACESSETSIALSIACCATLPLFLYLILLLL